jgi:enoyl-CoA hydratase/3-hydroxyacyl-CoA dehydrogenase
MKLTDNDIVEMAFFPVVNEACRVLDEGIALKASDLDVASIMGMGFPSYRFNCLFLNPNSLSFFSSYMLI